MNIKGKKILLRALELEDAETLREMINDSEIEKNVAGWSFPISRHAQREWIEKSNTNDKSFVFAIDLPGSGCIGIANLVDIDWKNRSASHGIKLVNKDFRRRGIGTDTVLTIMKYVFNELQLNRLDTTIIAHNTASKKLFLKCGFKIEGLKKEALFKNGKYYDNYILGITHKDYKKTTSNKKQKS